MFIIIAPMKIMRILAAAALAIAAAGIVGAAAAEESKGESGAIIKGNKTGALSLTVYYDFSYNGIKVANVADTLTINDDGEYRINRTAAAVGLAKLLHGDVINSSAGRVAARGLQMSVYHQQRGSRPPQSAMFDGETLQLMRGDESRTEQETAPLYDYLTIIYSHYVAGEILTGTIRQTDGWRIREYEYETSAEETITTPFGELTTVPVSYKSNRGPRKFWLSPKMGFLPVRSVVEDKGQTFETTMTPAPGN